MSLPEIGKIHVLYDNEFVQNSEYALMAEYDLRTESYKRSKKIV